jgi:sulfur carrier protein ThiS
MKNFSKYVCAMIVGCLSYQGGVGQNKKKDDSFPTYEQIRGNKEETVDYVSPYGSKTWTVVAKQTYKPYLNAFGYGEDSVVYVLNGKRVKSRRKAEFEINRKDIRVERVSIGEVGKAGKRIIEIDYAPFKED